MAPKAKHSWFDVQMVIMTISMALSLILWNLFASPDRVAALRKAAEEAQANQPNPVEAPLTLEAPAISTTAIQLPEPGTKILLGGTAPQTQIIVQTKRGGGGGGGGGSSGGTATSTRSS